MIIDIGIIDIINMVIIVGNMLLVLFSLNTLIVLCNTLYKELSFDVVYPGSKYSDGSLEYEPPDINS